MSLAIPIDLLDKVIKQCGDPSALIEAANGLSAVGSSIGPSGDRIVSRWRRLDGCYFAPETAELVHAMEPVRVKTDSVARTIAPVTGAVTTYASTIAELKPKLIKVREEAAAFMAFAAAHPDWSGGGKQFSRYVQSHGELTPDQAEAAHHRHDRIVGEINELCAQVAKAEIDCVTIIRANMDLDAVPKEPEKAGAGGNDGAGGIDSNWEMPFLEGKNPFGSLWINKGPVLDRIGVGMAKSFMDGASAIISLGGFSFNWDPVSGSIKFDHGWHVTLRTLEGLGKIAAGAQPAAVVGALTMASLGHPGAWNKLKEGYSGLWRGATGAGLPGGAPVRIGYIFGNATQAAIPGPGKALIGKMAGLESEGWRVPVAAAGRMIEAGAKGHWIGLDMRMLDRAPRVGEWLHGHLPIDSMMTRVNGLKIWMAEHGEHDIVASHDRLGELDKADRAALERLHADNLRVADHAGWDRLVDSSPAGLTAGSRRALDEMANNIDHYRHIRDQLSDQGLADQHLLHAVDDGSAVAGRTSGGERVAVALGRLEGDTAGGAELRLDPKKGIEAFDEALRSGKTHELLDGDKPRHHGDDYVGIRDVTWGDKTQKEIYLAHNVRGKEVETVFGVLRDGEVIRLGSPRSFYAEGGTHALHLPVPHEVKELYLTQLKDSAWEAVPAHNLREAAIQSFEGNERHKEQNELAEEREEWEKWAEDWERLQASLGAGGE